jgi:carboxyl-terminal processing protease
MKTLIITVLAAVLLSSCEKILLDPEYENTPVDNFEYLWNNYDRYYGQFIVRDINWDSLYSVYRPLLNANSGQEDLYQVFRELIHHFRDDHVFIDPVGTRLPRIESGRSDTMKLQTDYSPETAESYLVQRIEFSDHITYGMMPGNIGYIQMDQFSDTKDFIVKAFKKILEDLRETKGLVFDIRRLEGGDDRVAKYIAGRFAVESKLYMTSRKRNGPAHDDFESEIKWYVVPEGEYQYTKPVVMLTGRFTASAGETFTWAMNENHNVIHAGDTTLGAFSDIMAMELPNGWIHTVAVGDYRNSNGENLEGNGVAPGIFVKSTKAETLAKIDRGLEKALELLNQ